MYTEAQMQHMNLELADMINFWCYDGNMPTEQSATTTAIKTDFFDIAPHPYKQTFL